MARRAKLLLTAAGIVGAPALSPFAGAQTDETKSRPAFEVASIKANPDCLGDSQSEQFSPGRVSVTCITLPNLIQAAYVTFASGHGRSALRLRLVGAPDWARSERFNLEAKAQGDTSMEQMFGPLLQTLLEERFRLKVHRETRELPVYFMTVAKSGVKMQRTREGSCVPVDLNHADQASPKFCARMTGRISGAQVTDDVYGMTMAEIASRFLTNRLDRPAIDKTGIDGMFDAHLVFSRDDVTNAPENPAADPGGASIFTAVQDQLGLKLSPATGPVEILVIDRVERPSAN